VDAWADKAVGGALGVVFVYAGVTLLMTRSAVDAGSLVPAQQARQQGFGAPDRPGRAGARHLYRRLLPRRLLVAVALHAAATVDEPPQSSTAW
jgi:hypothetical protein